MKGERMIIERTYLDRATIGDGYVLDKEGKIIFQFKTLELPWNDNMRRVSCIPEGDYKVQHMGPNSKRNYQYFYVMNVKDRDSILFHPGNHTHQILGCILPGDRHADINKDSVPDVLNTTVTLKKLTDIMVEPFFKLTIKRKE
jgi:hypothetical protein